MMPLLSIMFDLRWSIVNQVWSVQYIFLKNWKAEFVGHFLQKYMHKQEKSKQGLPNSLYFAVSFYFKSVN